MELGYRLSPHVYAHAPGSPRLEVNLYGLPTLQHFDPRKMVLKVRSLKGLPTDLAITPPWDFFDTYQACVGHVVLYDRKDKRVNLYTYGGDLKIHNEGDKTHCVLESEAPIMILGELSGFATILADETEILIAEAFANSEHDTEHFLSRLASVKPLQMYASCLKSSSFMLFR